VPGTSDSSRPDAFAAFVAAASVLVGSANWYRESARRSCGTVVIGASSPIDASCEDGAYRATTAAWSTDS